MTKSSNLKLLMDLVTSELFSSGHDSIRQRRDIKLLCWVFNNPILSRNLDFALYDRASLRFSHQHKNKITFAFQNKNGFEQTALKFRRPCVVGAAHSSQRWSNFFINFINTFDETVRKCSIKRFENHQKWIFLET